MKLVWTREEEFTWAYFRPAGLIEIKSGVDERWSNHSLGISQLQLRVSTAFARSTTIPHQQIKFHHGGLATTSGLVPRARCHG